MSGPRMVALLGRPDEPTDAVEEYCRYLRGGLRGRGTELEIARVSWASQGWPTALGELRQRAKSWRGDWVLVQYTALAWSARGFPQRFLRVLRALGDAGARIAVLYHDVEPYGGERLVDRLRRHSQLRTMKRALRLADCAIFTVALNVVSWIGDPPNNTQFIPIGSNLPVGSTCPESAVGSGEQMPRVVIFGITGGEIGTKECREIIAAAGLASQKLGKIAVHAFGRGALEAEPVLREGLQGLAVDLSVEGVLRAERVVEALCAGDVMLFVREPISSRRGSAIAGISCGLPVIAYRGPHTTAPITEAGVVLVSREQPEKLGEALVRVLSDSGYRALLAERSRAAHSRYFAWDAIAERYADVLQ
jgi:glycosyltransferase involved in cell wall biosynthesis